MRMKKMLSMASTIISGARICWMKDEDGRRVAVLAFLPESTQKLKDNVVKTRKLADRAEHLAVIEAGKIGNVVSQGVYMRGNGQNITATGIAEVPCNSETMYKLTSSGIPQLI